MHPSTTDDEGATTTTSSSGPSEWAAPLLPLTACNLPACVRDAQALAERYVSQFFSSRCLAALGLRYASVCVHVWGKK